MATNFERGGNPLKSMDIGDVKLVQDWLDLYSIPYDKENFRFLKNWKDNILEIVVPVDKELMIQKYKDAEEKFIPTFVKEGKVFITIQF